MNTPIEFFCAARDGHLDVVEAMLNGVDVNEPNAGGATALEMASHAGRLNVVEFLLRSGASVEPVESSPFSSALIGASKYEHVGVLELLLKAGANPNLADRNGQTALIWAAFHDVDVKIIRLLLDHGADATITDTDGITARDYAADAGHIEIVAILDQDAA